MRGRTYWRAVAVVLAATAWLAGAMGWGSISDRLLRIASGWFIAIGSVAIGTGVFAVARRLAAHRVNRVSPAVVAWLLNAVWSFAILQIAISSLFTRRMFGLTDYGDQMAELMYLFGLICVMGIVAIVFGAGVGQSDVRDRS